MCGIFGIVTKNVTSPASLRLLVDSLFLLSESRGKEASGLAFLAGDKISIYKQPIRSRKLIRQDDYKELFDKIDNVSPISIIGHSRLATNGLQIDNRNNQPVATKEGTIVHNGIVVNEDKLWGGLIQKKPKYEVDTEALLELVSTYFTKGYPVESSISKAYSDIEGSASVALFLKKEPYLILATNTGSLYFSEGKKRESFIFASESYILRKVKEEVNSFGSFGETINVAPGSGLKVDLFSLKINKFALNSRAKALKKKLLQPHKNYFRFVDISKNGAIYEKKDLVLYSPKNNLKKLTSHDFDYQRIYKLKRCTKCILPETMPFIEFDTTGICNYCRGYKRMRPRGKQALERLITPFRSKNGKPDCIVAFSGGRDSSYGLHLLKKELGMNPIAYTYDWGMVTDLARRNQARLVGKLGVEHIIVSADITFKRNNIRKNILAWLKRPELGMIPLLTVGDKQAEYYIDQVARRLKIKMVIYCSGCELENDEFKAGYSGIKNGYPDGILHNLSLSGKTKMAFYYARQFVANPLYLNTSIFDTAFAYFTTYIKRHGYIYLWHYIPWKEEKIISTLKNEYGWEKDPNTNLTWRTDDGTPAFYNYIFYQVQGFTEIDAFRSNQIREGDLTREEALKLVNDENKPRYEALKWYFDRVGLDADMVLTVVDKIPRLY